jgi:hypothetical protein
MKVMGIVLVVLALVAGITPMFTDCQSQGRALEVASPAMKPAAAPATGAGMGASATAAPAAAPSKTLVPMKCHWTGVAESVAAIPLGVLGLVGVVGLRRKETRRMMFGMGAVLGVLIVLLPSRLIGVCAHPDMLCNLVMRPVLTLAGGLTVAVSLVGLVLSRGRDFEEV